VIIVPKSYLQPLTVLHVKYWLNIANITKKKHKSKSYVVLILSRTVLLYLIVRGEFMVCKMYFQKKVNELIRDTTRFENEIGLKCQKTLVRHLAWHLSVKQFDKGSFFPGIWHKNWYLYWILTKMPRHLPF
jgi:hypothetical protein